MRKGYPPSLKLMAKGQWIFAVCCNRCNRCNRCNAHELRLCFICRLVLGSKPFCAPSRRALTGSAQERG
eukprot:1095797-Rhodomonas_salina.1